ncbi:helicase-associated domain-containing protein [Corynebacterium sp. 335C]
MSPDDRFPPFRRWLAARPDSFLEDLLRARPDAVSPPPKSTDVLAARLQLRASVQRILPELDATALAVLEAAVDAGAELEPVTAADVAASLRDALADAGVPARERPTVAHVRAALDDLRAAALVHGDGPAAGGAFSGRARANPGDHADRLMVVDGAWESLPAGWRLLPRAGEPTAAELRDALDAVDDRQRRMLGTLVEAGGLGVTRDAAPDADPAAPVPRLLAAGLLDRVDDRTVRLPGRVRSLLRGEPLPEGPVPLRPGAPETTEPRDVDGTAAGAALETILGVRDLLELLGERPASTLKDGAIGVREQRRLLEATGLDLPGLARLVALCTAAGLIAAGTPHPLPADDDGGDSLAPTETADAFLAAADPARWAMLVDGLRSSEQAPWRVGAPGPDGRTVMLLTAGATRAGLPRLRGVLGDLLCGELDPGEALADPAGELLRRRPLVAVRTPAAVLRGAVDDLVALGLAVRDGDAVAASAAWRAARDARGDELADALAPLLPAPTTILIPQADLTILVPGPAGPELTGPLARFAEPESQGLATVHRVTEDSVRAALDGGMTAAEIHSFLVDRSFGDVPQSLTYLIDDVARRHGRLRGGPASSYLRCDDAALLAAVMAAPVAEALGLRRIADTVVVSPVAPARLIDALRAAGHAAVAEDAGGATLDLSPAPCRVEDPPRRPAPDHRADDGPVSRALEALRRGDRAAGDGSGRIGMDDDPATGAAAQALLQRSARAGRDVIIGYVDRNGRAARRRVRPVTVTGGQVDAIDPAGGDVLRFLLHRVTEVEPAD